LDKAYVKILHKIVGFFSGAVTKASRVFEEQVVMIEKYLLVISRLLDLCHL
jgi:hypothetical protein